MKGIKIVLSVMLMGMVCTGCSVKEQAEKGKLTEDQKKEYDMGWKQDVVQELNNFLIQDASMYEATVYDENYKVSEKKEISGSEIKETEPDIGKHIIYALKEDENQKTEINGYDHYFLYQGTYINNAEDYFSKGTDSATADDLSFMSVKDTEGELREILKYAGVETKGEPAVKVFDRQSCDSLNIGSETECYVFSFDGKKEEKIQIIYGENGILGLKYSIK